MMTLPYPACAGKHLSFVPPHVFTLLQRTGQTH